MKSKLPPSVIFFTEKGIQFASSPSTVVSLNLPATVYRDLEIQDKNAFKAALDDFIAKNKITPSEVVLILSETTYFEQEIKTTNRVTAESEAQKFLEIIPFNLVDLKVFPFAGGFKAVAINRDIHQFLSECLKLDGFQLGGVYPISAFPQMSSKSGLNPELIKYILKTTSSVKSLNFLSIAPASGPQTKLSTDVQERKTEIALISVFAVLLIILVMVVIFKRPF